MLDSRRLPRKHYKNETTTDSKRRHTKCALEAYGDTFRYRYVEIRSTKSRESRDPGLGADAGCGTDMEARVVEFGVKSRSCTFGV